MGSRKHIRAEKVKEEKKSLYVAKLVNNPTSPRKTRYTADLVRGMDIDKALATLQYSQREAAPKMRKLLLSAIANWQSKNEGEKLEDAGLYIKTLFVDGGAILRRMRPAPQGRGYRIRKRSNHITMVLGSRKEEVVEVEQSEKEN